MGDDEMGVVESMKYAALRTADNVKKVASDSVDSLKEAAKGSAENLKNVANNTSNSMNEVARGSAETVQDAARESSEYMKDFADNTSRSLQDLLNNVDWNSFAFGLLTGTALIWIGWNVYTVRNKKPRK